MTGPLSEIEIGFVGVALTLVIFAVIGLNSVLLEGYRLEPGRVLPRLTNPLSVAIVILALLLLAISVALGIGITQGWGPAALGLLAGAGSMTLTLYSTHVVVLASALGARGGTVLAVHSVLAVVVGAAFASVPTRGPLEAMVSGATRLVPLRRGRLSPPR